MAMARDGLLPQYFARIHPRFRTPHITTIWTGVVVGGVAMVTNIGDLADLTNIGTLFAFILVCLGVNVLRRVAPERPRPFRVPFVPVFPNPWCNPLHRADAEPASDDLDPILCLARNRIDNLFPLQCAPQQTAPWSGRRDHRRHSPSVDQNVDRETL